MDILRILLETTVYSGVVFAAVMLFKRFFKNKISPGLHLCIWLLLVARLVLPVTFQSGFNFFTIPAETKVEALAAPAAQTDQPMLSVRDSSTDNGTANEDVQPQPGNIPVNPTPANNGGHALIKFGWEDALIAVWIAGMCVSATYLIYTYRRLALKLKRSSVLPTNELYRLFCECRGELKIKGKARIRIVCGDSGPALLFPATVLIPAKALEMDRGRVKMAIMHELTHYKRKDHAVNMLLLILRSVYWFNPFVWLANEKIREDIETACDNDVVKQWEGAEKTFYAETILSMCKFSRQEMALGMASRNNRRIMEKRIRGIYTKPKSKVSIKIASVLLACVVGVCCFTTACQPTPEKPAVVNKNDGALESTIASTENPEQPQPSQAADALYEQLGAPKHWQAQREAADGMLTVADADVSLPEVSQVPVASAELRTFTQDEVNKVGELLFGGDAVYYYDDISLTKERIESMILEEKRYLAEMEAEGEEFFVEKAKTNIAYYESIYADAPDEADVRQVDLTMGDIESPYNMDERSTGVRVTTEKDGEKFMFSVFNNPDDNIISMGVSNDISFPGGAPVDEPYGVSITKEQAAEIAAPIAAQLTNELQLSHVGAAANFGEFTGRKWGWACVFTRTINGCPTTYTCNDVGSNIESEMKAPVRYEQMVIVVDGKGVMAFQWTSPMTVTAIENENVTLLPFGEISEKAMEQVEVMHLEYKEIETESLMGSGRDDIDVDEGKYATVTGVQFGLMRVDKKDGGYYYLPVWDFYNQPENSEEFKKAHPDWFTEPEYVDEQGNILGGIIDSFAPPETFKPVTINAIDGSIVDRFLGY